MSKQVPSQDSVHCAGKYCTNFVHRLHSGKSCKSCGSHLCQECYDKIGYCEDCQEPVLTEHDKETMEADLNRVYYEDAMGKAVNFTPEELKQMEDCWKFYDKIMGKPINLAVEYRKIAENPELYPHIKTIDDFFDEYDIPSLARTEFAVASILKQMKEIIDEDLAEEHAKSLTENIDPDSPAVNPAYDLEEEDA